MKWDKRGIVLSKVAKWLIAIALLVLVFGLIAVLAGKGSEALTFFSNKLRFWG